MTPQRAIEILSEHSPSCGVYVAVYLPDDAVVDVCVSMTAAEWRELSPETVKDAEQ
jgi:hypothetical protein